MLEIEKYIVKEPREYVRFPVSIRVKTGTEVHQALKGLHDERKLAEKAFELLELYYTNPNVKAVVDEAQKN